MSWSVAVFGWPAVAAAGLAFSAAFLFRRSWLGLVGAALAAPFCFLVSLYPIPVGRVGGIIAFAANFVCAWLLYRGRREVAFAFLLPFMIVAMLFAIVVIGSR